MTVADNVRKMALGRPWRAYAHTLFMYCELPEQIAPAGWHNWNDPSREATSRYEEYRNYGPGARPAERVAWSRQLSDKEAAAVSVAKVCGDWNPYATRFLNPAECCQGK